MVLALGGGALPSAPETGERYVVQATGVAVDLRAVARDHGLRVAQTIPSLRSAVLTGAPGQLASLRADARLRWAAPDHPCRVAGDGGCCSPGIQDLSTDDLTRERARLDAAFGALRARARGRGVVVAVLDTGLAADHPALHDAVHGGTSMLAGVPWDEDSSGHGTAMAALVAARGHHAPEGVAPEARILAVRVADKSGRAWAADVAAGIVQAVDRGARVVLLALGARLPAPVLDEAMAYAESRGVLVVAAAGNRNVNQDLFPAADPRALSVGAASDAGEIGWSTALAPTTDVLAPGERALTALPRGVGSVSGTSVAAARLAGVAALLVELRPELSPAALRSLIIGSRRPVLAAHPDLARVFPAGLVDAAALARELDAPRGRPALLELRTLPPAARVGDPLRALVRVRNAGAAPTPADEVALSRAGAALGRIAVPALAPGEERELSLDLVAPAAGQLQAMLGAERRTAELVGVSAPRRDLAISRLLALPTSEGGLVLEVEVEGRGGAAITAQMEGQLGDIALGPVDVPPLGPGARFVTRLEMNPEQMASLPGRVATCQLFLATADEDAQNDAAALDLLPPGAPEARSALATQYQQNGELNLIADAPWRLEPARDWVPVLLFVPEKGDLDPNTFVSIQRATLSSRLVANRAAAATVVYDDQNGGPSTAAPGTVILDDMGQPQRAGGAPDLRLFRHEQLDRPGRYAIVRVPRNALGVAPVPTSDEVRFITAEMEWSNRRRFLYLFTQTRTGTYKKTVRVQFAAAPRPRLPGEGQYFDAHLHTYAEWYQDDGFDPLAPRRNLGGPIPMVQEAAFAMGMTDAVDAVKDRVITTDHAAFYEPGDDLRVRPPFGPTALANSAGKSEFERMGELFGLTRSEEVAFHAPQNMFGGLSVPFGAHVLAYRAQHVPGAWHGGSSLARALGDPYPDLPLQQLIGTLARASRGENRHAALFAAHPYGGTDWKPEHHLAAWEPDPALRTDLSVNAEQDGFVTKGLQVWNGVEARRVPSSRVDFMDVNPWNDPDFVQGTGEWDKNLEDGLGHWHGLLSQVADYELKARPGVRFPRKIFIAAGNDAHGDFNFTESRDATIINLQSTLRIHGRAFGTCLTYAMGEGQAAASAPERALEALLDGNSVLTDGPLATLALDAEDRFDAGALRWQDRSPRFADKDGRMGGGGVFDGVGTALVRRGSPAVRMSYRWQSTAEFGPVRQIELYRSSAGDPNPLGQRASGSSLLTARGHLAPGQGGADQDERLDPAEEGLIQATTALQLGAYTGDPALPTVDDKRCLTNPVWAVPYDVTVTVDRTDTDAQGKGSIPAGALHVVVELDASLHRDDYGFELKALDANGDSSDGSTGPIDQLVPAWGPSAKGVEDGRLELTNTRPIPLDLDRYGSGPDQVTFVVYSYRPLQDAFQNELHRVAFSFEQAGIGTGGGTGPAVQRSGSTTPGATPAPTTTTGGGRRGGGGCTLSTQAAPAFGAPLLLLVALALLARRGARPAPCRVRRGD